MLTNKYNIRKNRFRLFLIAVTIFSIFYVRFFTETFEVLPRVFQLMDFGVIAFLILILIIWAFKRQVFIDGDIGKLVLIYFMIVLLSALFNLEYTGFVLVVSFLFLQLEGVVFFWFILNANLTYENILRIIRWLLTAGVLQIVISILQIPGSMTTSPDAVVGTFGNNNSQMVFFLVTFTFALFGAYLYKRIKIFLWLLPLIIIVFLAASFRLVWVSFPATIFFLWYISGTMKKGKKFLLPVAVSLTIIFTVGSHFASGSSKFSQVAEFDYKFTELGKVRAILATFEMFSDYPEKILFGTGPGVYASRTFRTFGAGSNEKSNPTTGIIEVKYPSPFVKEYLVPAKLYAGKKFGSTFDWYYSSILSNLGETGILGFFFFFFIYWIVLKKVYVIHKSSRRNIYLFSLSLAAVGAILFLAQMSVNDDWFGVARITLPTWLIIGLVYRMDQLLKNDKVGNSKNSEKLIN